ncbi:hypothetical protein JHK84_041280 [Glycine max]|nr:hypothetical protein JHK84_041280 [Glycine max]
MRRKGVGTTAVKSWMVVSEAGHSRLEDVGKHSIMRRTGLPARDLRVLDPVLSYPSSILGRERAIVVNFEHVKAIITASELLLINSSNPFFLSFLQDLQTRLSNLNPSHRLNYPALDELTSQLSTLNLERVRQIKSRLVELSGRVQKVADELEHLLDDDNDMAEMYLTKKLNARLCDQSSLKLEGYNSEFEDNDQSDESNSEKYDKFLCPKLDVEELEMLLEAYFAQTNGILQRLSSLSEYVDDREDYINIVLDDKQNELLQAAIIFDTINMILNVGIVVVGLFGMNI